MTPTTEDLETLFCYEKRFGKIQFRVTSDVIVIYEFWRYGLYKRVFTDGFIYYFIGRNYGAVKRDIYRFNANDI